MIAQEIAPEFAGAVEASLPLPTADMDGDALFHLGMMYSAGSEERRVGKECGLLCRSRWSPYH